MASARLRGILSGHAAVAGRIWVAGFPCLVIAFVCFSGEHLLRHNILAEQASNSLAFVRGESGDVLQCTLSPTRDLSAQPDYGSCQVVDQNESLFGSHVHVQARSVGVPHVPFDLEYQCVCEKNQVSSWRTVLYQPTDPPSALPGGERLDVLRAFVVMRVCAGLALLHMLACACGVLGWLRAAAVSGRISLVWVWARRTLLEAYGPDHTESLDHHRIKELVKQKRLRRARAMLHGGRPLLIFFLIIETFSWWGYVETYEHALEYLYDSIVAPSLGLAAFILPCVLRLQPASPMLLDGINVLLNAMWAWKYLVLGHIRGVELDSMVNTRTPGKGYLFHAQWMLASRLIHSLGCSNWNLPLALNIIVTVVDMYSFGKCDPTRKQQYIFQQVMICAGWSAILWWDEQQLVAEAIALVHAETSENNYALAHRVLAASCDVTACLDADLNFLEPCPKLAHMLLKHPKSAADGCSFVNHVSPGDLDAVRTLMRAEVELTLSKAFGQEPASTAHVKLRDAYQKEISVQLFLCCGAQGSGQVKFLIGITEREEIFAQGGQVPQDQASKDLPRLCPLLEGSAVRFDGDDKVSSSSCVPMSAASSQASGSSAESGEEEDEDEGVTRTDLSVHIDADSSDLTFLWCSSAFVRLSGVQGVGIGLCRWLIPGKAGPFLAWLRASELPPERRRRVILQPPGLRNARFCLRCRRVAVRTEPCKGSAATKAVQLVFSSLTLSASSNGSSSRDALRRRKLQVKPDMVPLRFDVEVPDLTVVCGDPPLVMRRFFPGLKTGESLQTLLANGNAFTDIISNLAEKVIDGTRPADAALSLGYWKLRSCEPEPCLARFKLTGFISSVAEPQSGGLSCQLQLLIPQVDAHGGCQAEGECEDEVRIILGEDHTGADMVILECDAQLTHSVGFPPQGHSFLAWLVDPIGFATWAASIHDFSKGDVVPLAALHFGELRLRPEDDAAEEGWELRATCRCDTLPWDLARRDALLSIQLSGMQMVQRRALRCSL